MKVNCKNCSEDITLEVDRRFEKFIIGQNKCNKCHSNEKRYISEADLYLYLSGIEIIYLIDALVAVLIYDKLEMYWWLIPIFILFLIPTYVIQKYLSRYIYEKAPFKKESAYVKQNEDQEKIRKGINTQFVIFFLFAFGAIMINTYRIEFLFGMCLDIVASILRAILGIRNEKKENSSH